MSDQILKAASQEEAAVIRKHAGTRPQVVYLQDLMWLDNIILEMMERDHMPKKKFRRYNNATNLGKARKIAAIKQVNYFKRNRFDTSAAPGLDNTVPGIKLKGDAPEIYAAIRKGEAFLVGSFATAGALKKEIIKATIPTTIPAIANPFPFTVVVSVIFILFLHFIILKIKSYKLKETCNFSKF